MKRTFLVIVIICSTLCSFAQRLNEHGLKMVSEIEYLRDARKGTIYNYKFSYDDNNRLSRMTIYKDGKLFRDFVKTDDGIAATDLGTDTQRPMTWEVEYDGYGNISCIVMCEEFDAGIITKNEIKYFYKWDDKEKAFCLNKSIWTQTTKEKGQTSWHGDSVGSIETTDIKIIDGFILTGKENYVIDYNRPNDTNIDLNCFFDCIGGSGTFTMTEWGISRRKYFIDRSMLSLYQSGCFRDAFHYDDKDNLIGFERICPDAKYCEWSVKIKYVY